MTPEEFVDIACQLTDAAGIWGGAASDPLAYVPFDMMFSPDGKTATGYVNGSAFVEQMDLLASGYEQGCFPSANVLDPWAQGRDYFSRGELAMVITDFQDLDQVDNAGINWGSTTPADARRRGAVLLRVERQRGRDGQHRAPRRGGLRRLRDHGGAADPL